MKSPNFEPFNELVTRIRNDLFSSIPSLREADRIRALITDEYAEILGQRALVMCGEVVYFKHDEQNGTRSKGLRYPESGPRPSTGIEITGTIADVTTIGRADWLIGRGTQVNYFEPCLTIFDDAMDGDIRSNIPLVTLDHIASIE